MTELQKGQCWKCQAELDSLEFGRADTCPKCRWDTRVCKNCTYYDTAAYNECREPQADRVVDKEKSNFCDYFRPRSPGTGGASGTSKPDPRAAAEALFKNLKKS